MDRPDLRIESPPWNRAESYAPEPRQPLLERIADTLQSPRFVLFYLGWISGCFFTVAVALVWEQVA